MENKDWKDIYNIYPNFFEAITPWGFECDKGWYDLIKKLVEDIFKWYSEYKPKELDNFKILQVKEKYGTLRFYVGSSYEKVFDMIGEAERESAKICEICGEPGKVKDIGGSWYKCVCNNHYKDIIKERE